VNSVVVGPEDTREEDMRIPGKEEMHIDGVQISFHKNFLMTFHRSISTHTVERRRVGFALHFTMVL
jgi:hypothetical protein